MKKVSKIIGIVAFIAIIVLANLSFATSSELELVKPIDIQNTVNDTNLDDVDDKYSPELEDEIFRTIFGDDYQNLTMDSITGSDSKSLIAENIEGQEVIRGDKYIREDVFDFSNIGDGNYLIIGNDITISSPNITGNVAIIAENIKITGTISGSVVAAGENVTVSGSMLDLYTVGSNLTVENGAFIERALKTCGTNVNIKGGEVGYELYSVAEHTTIAKEAFMPEKVSYSGELEAPDNIKEIAIVIEGANELQETSQMFEQAVNTLSKVLKTVYVVITSLVHLIVLVILAMLLKKSVDVEELRTKIVTNSLQGFLYYIIIFAIIVVCCITIVLLPMAVSMVFVLIPSITLITLVGTILLAHLVLKDKASSTGLVVVTAAVVDLLLRLMMFTPARIVSTICSFILSCIGLSFIGKKLSGGVNPKPVTVAKVDASEVDSSIPVVEEKTENKEE